VARTADRLTQLRRTAATAEAYQLECELISPRRAGQLYPVMRTDDLAGAIWLPGGGRANPADLTAALARGARDRGVTIRERTRVTAVLAAGGAVTGVRTDAGDVEAEVVVNCAGQWAKQVGATCGATVPPLPPAPGPSCPRPLLPPAPPAPGPSCPTHPTRRTAIAWPPFVRPAAMHLRTTVRLLPKCTEDLAVAEDPGSYSCLIPPYKPYLPRNSGLLVYVS
jgi:glycine/D-amino acid oxidase-like deaminating enzyme